jgi:glycosyltransferase involved in cell wall biosynthesis
LTVDPIFWQETILSKAEIPASPKGNPPFFLTVGTIEPRKNLLNVLKAWLLLKTPVNLIHVGRAGWKNQPIMDFIKKNGTSDSKDSTQTWVFPDGRKFRHYEGISVEQLCLLYQQALGLVYPSFYEGFGLPVLEALTQGCPVITSRDSAMSEIAQDAAGYCDPFDVSSIAAEMESFLVDRSGVENRIKQGRIQADQFRPDLFVQKLVQVWQEVSQRARI